MFVIHYKLSLTRLAQPLYPPLSPPPSLLLEDIPDEVDWGWDAGSVFVPVSADRQVTARYLRVDGGKRDLLLSP